MCYYITMKKDKDLIELLSKKEHDRWAKWQKHVHSCCTSNEDGSLTIPKEKVDRWERQIKTDYDNLSEQEKDSDRRQVLETLKTIKYYHKNNPPKGIIVAGFGAIGKTWLGEHYANIIDMESGFYAHINEGFESIDVEKRKGTTMRPANPDWPQNYYNAIIDARKRYDVVLTSMHWDLLKFYEENNIPYYLAFPEQNSEEILAKRCYARGNNATFTENMIKNVKIWNEKLKNYKPVKLLILKKNEYLEDILKQEGLI